MLPQINSQEVSAWAGRQINRAAGFIRQVSITAAAHYAEFSLDNDESEEFPGTKNAKM